MIGLHDLTHDEYHADPCPEPSLSASGISKLIHESPAHFAAWHPRISTYGPEEMPEEKDKKALRIGNAVHALILGKGRTIRVAPDSLRDWRKKEAQAFRDDAKANGCLALLSDEMVRSQLIASLAVPKIKRYFGEWPIGKSEQAMIWQRPTKHGKIWARAYADHIWPEGDLDLKTTALTISDDGIAKKTANLDEDTQAAWRREGGAMLFPEHADTRTYTLVELEVEPPFEVRFAELSQATLSIAHQACDAAADLFAKCLRENRWPGRPEKVTIEPLAWRTRELAGFMLRTGYLQQDEYDELVYGPSDKIMASEVA